VNCSAIPIQKAAAGEPACEGASIDMVLDARRVRLQTRYKEASQ